MSDLLFGIPIIPWFQETMNLMPIHGEGTPKIWSDCWYEAYKKLGGEKKSCGTKGCPMSAAYGLWYLGHIVGSSQACKDWEITKINYELGKNAAYTVISLEILKQLKSDISKKVLWTIVREKYEQRVNEKAAKGEQGQIKIALALFNANLIIFP